MIVVHAIAACLVVMTLVLVGQPIYANDTWIHLALGEAFVQAGGPWLSADPHLFAAPSPPPPSSWLGSVAIYAVRDAFGFTGLRVFHVLCVGGILGLAWAAFRRGSGTRLGASLGLIAFLLLSTYRLVQMRPHLYTIGATLLLYLLLVAPRRTPTPGAIAISALVAAIWANVHAAFLLGPILILGTSLSLFALAMVSSLAFGPEPDSEVEAEAFARARGLGLAGGALLLATLLNPQGWNAHLAYFRGGEETIGLGVVIDEWGRTDLFSLPVLNLPPTPAAWFVCWLCVLGLVLGVVELFRERSGPSLRSPDQRIDPALVALSVAGLAAALFASRFLWLGFFPLALLAWVVAHRREAGAGWERTMPWAAAALGAALCAMHLYAGDWTITSKALGRSLPAFKEAYTQPYRADKFHGHGVWFLADAGIEGRIQNDYSLGGFMSVWLSPALQMSSSGTMNVAQKAMQDQMAIGMRGPNEEGRSYLQLLDLYEIDVFLGSGFPVVPPPGRPLASSVRDLEWEPDWILIYRNLRSSIFLRRGDRNQANLERVARYYAERGVPFDSVYGLRVDEVIQHAPRWAIANGVIPMDWNEMMRVVAQDQARVQVSDQTRRMSLLYSVLGLYDRALKADRWILTREPTDGLTAHRVIWSLTQLRRFDEALEAALEFEAGPLGAAINGAWSAQMRGLLAFDESGRVQRAARTPLLQRAQQQLVQLGRLPAPARTSREK
ncbi:MAG: hypothetical protein AB8G23_18410 [Myxococcota bacterium]